MRKRLILWIWLIYSFQIHAQLYIPSGVDVFVKQGETLQIDGLALTPSSDFTLTNTTIQRTDAHTITPYTSGNYIKRYFSFSNTTSPFTGSIRFSYAGADLTGFSSGALIPEADLRMNYFNGSNWASTTDLPNQTNDFVLSSIPSIGLKIITLAATNGAMPLTWLQFTGEKKESTVGLNWSTLNEQNTRDFLVQHSISGGSWKNIGVVQAAGNSTIMRNYLFRHSTPETGYNFYRLIQRDIDGQFSYSKVVSVLMNKEEVKWKAFPNPVIDGKLNILLNEATTVILYDVNGRQVLSKQMNPGIQTLQVSDLPGGTYHIKVGKESANIIIN